MEGPTKIRQSAVNLNQPPKKKKARQKSLMGGKVTRPVKGGYPYLLLQPSGPFPFAYFIGGSEYKCGDVLVIRGRFGECRFCDNMDPELGLPSLPAQSFELAFADPPYNISYSGPCGLGDSPEDLSTWKERTELYDDHMEDSAYEAWCIRWASQAMRVATNLVLTPGMPNTYLVWYKNFEVFDRFVWYKPNSQSGGSKGAYFLKHEDILLMRKPRVRYAMSVFNRPLRNGFMRDNRFLHPAPKDYLLMKDLLGYATSVIDPFLGSGTSGEVSESEGKIWLGFEKNVMYFPDIWNRLCRGARRYERSGYQKKLPC